MKIFLIGFMGSGKTTVGNLLAKKLNLHLIEMDEIILKKSGKKSISDIFSLKGEEYFRNLETETIKEISQLDNVVVSTGGGIIMKEANHKFLKKGKVIYLNTSFNVLENRLNGDDSRPLFKDIKGAKKLFDLRKNIYENVANQVVLTDNLTIDQVVNKIFKFL